MKALNINALLGCSANALVISSCTFLAACSTVTTDTTNVKNNNNTSSASTILTQPSGNTNLLARPPKNDRLPNELLPPKVQ